MSEKGSRSIADTQKSVCLADKMATDRQRADASDDLLALLELRN